MDRAFVVAVVLFGGTTLAGKGLPSREELMRRCRQEAKAAGEDSLGCKEQVEETLAALREQVEENRHHQACFKACVKAKRPKLVCSELATDDACSKDPKTYKP